MTLSDLERLARSATEIPPLTVGQTAISNETRAAFLLACSPERILALIAYVRDLEDGVRAALSNADRMVKAVNEAPEFLEAFKISASAERDELLARVRELESEVAQLKVDLNEARGAAIDGIFVSYSRGGSQGDRGR